MATYTIQKTHFRNDPRFGRTTTLLKNGVVVLVLMGVVPKHAIVAQYEGRL